MSDSVIDFQALDAADQRLFLNDHVQQDARAVCSRGVGCRRGAGSSAMKYQVGLGRIMNVADAR